MGAKMGGGGGGKFDLGQNSDMNVTPFVDVMLVLLIIFMVAAPLATVDVRVELVREGVRAVALALFVLSLTAAAHVVVFAVSGSVALLADLIHNSGDAPPRSRSA